MPILGCRKAGITKARATQAELHQRTERLIASIYRVKDRHRPQEIWFIVRAIELHVLQSDMLLEMACVEAPLPISYFKSAVKIIDDQLHDILDLVRPILHPKQPKRRPRKK
jgi:hypothetical protein